MSLMLNMDIVPLESSGAVSDVMDDSSGAEAVFMDSWQLFTSGLSESG
jgi:hypothetical protein